MTTFSSLFMVGILSKRSKLCFLEGFIWEVLGRVGILAVLFVKMV